MEEYHHGGEASQIRFKVCVSGSVWRWEQANKKTDGSSVPLLLFPHLCGNPRGTWNGTDAQQWSQCVCECVGVHIYVYMKGYEVNWTVNMALFMTGFMK